MTLVCSGCDEVITNNSFMKCSNKRCKKLFEIDCLGIQQEQFEKFTQEYRGVWVCPDRVFAHFTCINLGLPGHKNYIMASAADNQAQARTDDTTTRRTQRQQQDDDKFRAEVFSRFDRLEAQAASLPNILVEELLFLNKTGQSDLYTRNKNLEDKMTNIDNKMTAHVNQLTSRVMLLESFMGTIQRQLYQLDLKKQSQNIAASFSASRINEQASPKPSEGGAIKPGEQVQGQDEDAALELICGKKDKKKGGKGQLESWTMQI